MSTYDELDKLTDEEVHARIQQIVAVIGPSPMVVMLAERHQLGERAWDKTSKAAHPDLKAALYQIEIGEQKKQLVRMLSGVEQRLQEIQDGYAALRGWLDDDRQLAADGGHAKRPTDWAHVIGRLEGLLLQTKEPVIAATLALQGAYRAGWVARGSLRWQEKLGVAEATTEEELAKEISKDTAWLIDLMDMMQGEKPRLTKHLQDQKALTKKVWANHDNKALTSYLSNVAFQTIVQPLVTGLRATIASVAARLGEAEQEIADATSGKKPYVHALRGLWMAQNILLGVGASTKALWEIAARAGHEAVIAAKEWREEKAAP